MRILLNNFDSIIAESKNLSNAIPGIIRIGLVGNPFEVAVLPELIGRYHNQNPELEIELEHLNNNRLKQHLINRECNLIFDLEDDIKNIKGVEFKPLTTGKLVAVIPTSNPLSEKSSLTISDLHGQKVFLMNPSWCSPKQLQINYQVLEKGHTKKAVQVNVTQAADMMAKAQLGIEITNSCVCERKYENCQIVPFKSEEKLTYGVAKLKSYKSPLVNDFMKAITAEKFQRILAK
ncbi:substrate-binding domain-containing protein [Lactobacillus sp. HT06-2]|uniref:substrate-binding domain-containing protein n=1 Tax=Lactobacillus sp. HT06-2 TaxID=2080222 RepID=UPI000CD847E0|nr:substrate-binding domain-containing protein [Lactobacillus sp. HT06-2]